MRFNTVEATLMPWQSVVINHVASVLEQQTDLPVHSVLAYHPAGAGKTMTLSIIYKEFFAHTCAEDAVLYLPLAIGNTEYEAFFQRMKAFYPDDDLYKESGNGKTLLKSRKLKKAGENGLDCVMMDTYTDMHHWKDFDAMKTRYYKVKNQVGFRVGEGGSADKRPIGVLFIIDEVHELLKDEQESRERYNALLGFLQEIQKDFCDMEKQAEGNVRPLFRLLMLSATPFETLEQLDKLKDLAHAYNFVENQAGGSEVVETGFVGPATIVKMEMAMAKRKKIGETERVAAKKQKAAPRGDPSTKGFNAVKIRHLPNLSVGYLKTLPRSLQAGHEFVVENTVPADPIGYSDMHTSTHLDIPLLDQLHANICEVHHNSRTALPNTTARQLVFFPKDKETGKSILDDVATRQLLIDRLHQSKGLQGDREYTTSHAAGTSFTNTAEEGQIRFVLIYDKCDKFHEMVQAFGNIERQDFFAVSDVHFVGEPSSNTEYVQNLYRSIRLCSHVNVDPLVKVHLYKFDTEADCFMDPLAATRTSFLNRFAIDAEPEKTSVMRPVTNLEEEKGRLSQFATQFATKVLKTIGMGEAMLEPPLEEVHESTFKSFYEPPFANATGVMRVHGDATARYKNVTSDEANRFQRIEYLRDRLRSVQPRMFTPAFDLVTVDDIETYLERVLVPTENAMDFMKHYAEQSDKCERAMSVYAYFEAVDSMLPLIIPYSLEMLTSIEWKVAEYLRKILTTGYEAGIVSVAETMNVARRDSSHRETIRKIGEQFISLTDYLQKSISSMRVTWEHIRAPVRFDLPALLEFCEKTNSLSEFAISTICLPNNEFGLVEIMTEGRDALKRAVMDTAWRDNVQFVVPEYAYELNVTRGETYNLVKEGFDGRFETFEALKNAWRGKLYTVNQGSNIDKTTYIMEPFDLTTVFDWWEAYRQGMWGYRLRQALFDASRAPEDRLVTVASIKSLVDILNGCIATPETVDHIDISRLTQNLILDQSTPTYAPVQVFKESALQQFPSQQLTLWQMNDKLPRSLSDSSDTISSQHLLLWMPDYGLAPENSPLQAAYAHSERAVVFYEENDEFDSDDLGSARVFATWCASERWRTPSSQMTF
ncbi:hypothetical protein CYMTET_47758 [Cymbomonas tetramitiformis]|uniref:Uncharacterized protein n=1 Tax=Cymbomonas tetramitiformis TaxID=36881 RepID=A0AAE0BV74_9CHLO|nr:hypothetical protein CYMTET_47758 [Cymbomonas tetramitiformis]